MSLLALISLGNGPKEPNFGGEGGMLKLSKAYLRG